MAKLVEILRSQGKCEAAEEIHRQALELSENVLSFSPKYYGPTKLKRSL